ncbi:hypothetical protein M407DRAFT_241218 [Tulasnella calospora MUT 4182]|uniref:Uncharacterized protein n=1 Tax=Tulasnella calospora MUT 4182 TaxID=1051891 RepID=A0A0C3MH01_9AGAM|nr:hypothetical protein M407DRAFT_241218 [Tulasnella calospora MUT 4182]
MYYISFYEFQTHSIRRIRHCTYGECPCSCAFRLSYDIARRILGEYPAPAKFIAGAWDTTLGVLRPSRRFPALS